MSRRHLAAGALLAAVLAGEVVGRWLVGNLSLVEAVPRRQPRGLDAWPALVVAAKIGIGLVLARLVWRLARARRLASAGERILVRRGIRAGRPLLTVGLSPRAWLTSFAAMLILYLAPTSSAELSSGYWRLAASRLHTQSLLVFALLAVVIAVLWRTISRWLAALERYGESLQALIRAAYRVRPASRRASAAARAPRSLFGGSFQSRPPPAPA